MVVSMGKNMAELKGSIVVEHLAQLKDSSKAAEMVNTMAAQWGDVQADATAGW